MIETRARGFSSKRAAELAGISYRQLDYWSRIGIVTPSLADADGSGSRRRWSLDDLRLLVALAEIVQLGPQIGQLGPIVEELTLLQSWGGHLFVSRRGLIGRSLDVLDGDRVGMVIDLGALMRSIAEKLTEEETAALPRLERGGRP